MDVPRTHRRSNASRLLPAVAGVLVLGSITAVLQLSRAAPPSIERSSMLVGTASRGVLLRRVQGPGTLQSERVFWVSATHAGRVARIHVAPGATVAAEDVILELENPDLELALLNAEQQRAAARAELSRQEAGLEAVRFEGLSRIAQLEAEAKVSTREAEVTDALAKSALSPALEAARVRDKVLELEQRLALERERQKHFAASAERQIAAQREQVKSMEAVAEFYRRQIARLRVTAGESGVVQTLPLEPGQSVTPGTVLAKIAASDRLEAQLQIPEIQAKDVLVGQKATVDTRNGIVSGIVSRVDPAAVRGAVAVRISLDGTLPRGARPDLRIDGTIELENLDGVLSVPRPARAQEASVIGVFKLTAENRAVRVNVEFGRGTPTHLEVLRGLEAGEKIILSDMSRWDGVDDLDIR